MTINEYQKAALRTAGNNKDTYLDNACLGLAGEVGEVCDMVKKHRFQGHDLDENHLIEELGDVAWYLALACSSIDISLEEVLKTNVDKLMKRYPEGFSVERSVHRD